MPLQPGKSQIGFLRNFCPFYHNCHVEQMFPVVSVILHGGCGDGGDGGRGDGCGFVVVVVVLWWLWL